MKKTLSVICLVAIFVCSYIAAQSSYMSREMRDVENMLDEMQGKNRVGASSISQTGCFDEKKGGRGTVIAVPAIKVNGGAGDAWISQFFQDSVTNLLAKYSNMTVVDRANENLAVAEQKLSETGFYSDSDASQIGNMTNAQLIVVGTVQSIPSGYSVNFRINDVTTNEIRSSFSSRYPSTKIEDGTAVQDAVIELLAGLGIELTDAQRKSIAATPKKETDATRHLAQGVAAEDSEDYIVALALYIESGVPEAQENIQRILGDNIPTGSIQLRAAYYRAQTEKWKKIFAGLKTYLEDGVHLPIFVYDFSSAKDRISADGRKFDYTILQGIKLVPRRSALLLWSHVWSAWEAISENPENKAWAGASTPGSLYHEINNVLIYAKTYEITVDLFDDYGDAINHVTFRLKFDKSGSDSFRFFEIGRGNFKVQAQQKYFNENKFESVDFERIAIEDATPTLTPRITKISRQVGERGYVGSKLESIRAPALMSLAEWNLFCEALK